jgi:hypothetical protein
VLAARLRWHAPLLFLGSLLLTAWGNPTTYKGKGKVVYEGQPATGALVTFHGAGKNDKGPFHLTK